MGRDDSARLAVAEVPGSGPIQTFLADRSRRLGVWIVAGSVPLVGPDPKRVCSACLVIDADGRHVARYDKMHLFDVDMPDSDEGYRESAATVAGGETVVVDSPAGRLGLSICYDVRFPELFRSLSAQGAELLLVPSAFTQTTGEAHWSTLLRARAIENLCYVVAPAQAGLHANGRSTYGHSMIIDPWGVILDQRAAGEGIVIAEIDNERLARIRARFPVLQHRALVGC